MARSPASVPENAQFASSRWQACNGVHPWPAVLAASYDTEGPVLISWSTTAVVFAALAAPLQGPVVRTPCPVPAFWPVCVAQNSMTAATARRARTGPPATEGAAGSSKGFDWSSLAWDTPAFDAWQSRVVAVYGHPASTRMGLLGALRPAALHDSLRSLVALWQGADSVPVVPAYHMIAVVAQGHPGPSGRYRLRHSDATIGRIVGWAEAMDGIAILDIQPGRSTVAAELKTLMPWLAHPRVHLALDPEFAMGPDGVPGRRIGSMPARDVNLAITELGRLVDSLGLPPKLLVVHRFTHKMLPDAQAIIRDDPRVRVVIDMDGWGSAALKRATWRQVIVPMRYEHTGFKIFTTARHDGANPMGPEQVLQLSPAPNYIQYQ